jgi:hypothetical protein
MRFLKVNFNRIGENFRPFKSGLKKDVPKMEAMV